METAVKTDVLREMAEDPELGLLWNLSLGWLHWNGKTWSEVTDSTALRQVHEYQESRSIRPWTARQVSQLRGALEVDARTLDDCPHILNVQNGVVNLRTCEVRPHDPALRMTRIADAEYDPEATSDVWDRILSSLNGEIRDVLQLAVGQAATGEQGDSATLLYSEAPSGKSTLAKAVQDAFGSYAVATSGTRSMVYTRRNGDLRATRLAVIEEANDAAPNDLKLLTVPDEIVARRIRRDAFMHRPSHSLLMVANVWPAKALADEGSCRRTAVVGLSALDERGGADPALRRAMLDEGPAFRAAVLRWIVEGAVRWYAERGN